MSRKEMQVFKNDQFGEVRSVMVNGEPWFVAADVCRVLGHSNVTVALQMLDENEQAKQRLGQVSKNGVSQNREVNLVSEAGLYALVLRSNLPGAKVFKRWITHEVLPSLRKYGMYAASGVFENPETMAALIAALQHEQQRGDRLERRLNWLSSPSARKVLEAERARREDDGDDLPERTARLFVETLTQLVQEGSAKVVNLSEDWAGREDLVGWQDDRYLYIMPQAAYDQVEMRCRLQGDSFPVTRRALNKCLQSQEMIEGDERQHKATRIKTIGGRARRLLWIKRDQLR